MATNDFTEEVSAAAEEDFEEDGTKNFCDGPGKMKSLTSRPDETFTLDTEKWTILFASSDISIETVEIWISKHAPSTWTKEDGLGDWISIVSSRGRKFKAEREDDVDGLLESWKNFLGSERPVNYANIKELALQHTVLAGKWILVCSPGAKVDVLWSMVAKGIVDNSSWPCYSAKVSTINHFMDESKHQKHFVCIYNEDFTNLNQVLQSEQAIRKMGIKCELIYKPDVYTYVGVFHTNPWNLRPIIMRSRFDVKQGKSIIKYFVPV